MEEDIYCIVLTNLKSIEKNYTVALTEASNDKLYEELKKDLDKVALMQRKVFNYMNDQGYYDLKCVKDSDISKLYNELTEKYGNL